MSLLEIAASELVFGSVADCWPPAVLTICWYPEVQYQWLEGEDWRHSTSANSEVKGFFMVDSRASGSVEVARVGIGHHTCFNVTSMG